MSAIKDFLKKLAKSEDGNVESALVIIPLLILFIMGMQISIYSHARNFEKIRAQDSASTRAISGEFAEGDEFLHLEGSGDGQNLDLLITKRESRLSNFPPNIFVGNQNSKAIAVQGFAVIENQR
jgi:hypothetical protein